MFRCPVCHLVLEIWDLFVSCFLEVGILARRRVTASRPAKRTVLKSPQFSLDSFARFCHFLWRRKMVDTPHARATDGSTTAQPTSPRATPPPPFPREELRRIQSSHGSRDTRNESLSNRPNLASTRLPENATLLQGARKFDQLRPVPVWILSLFRVWCLGFRVSSGTHS